MKARIYHGASQNGANSAGSQRSAAARRRDDADDVAWLRACGKIDAKALAAGALRGIGSSGSCRERLKTGEIRRRRNRKM